MTSRALGLRPPCQLVHTASLWRIRHGISWVSLCFFLVLSAVGPLASCAQVRGGNGGPFKSPREPGVGRLLESKAYYLPNLQLRLPVLLSSFFFPFDIIGGASAEFCCLDCGFFSYC
ncbi:hypothetical protein M432DRAFT_597134 [Thermoascus aurantiacus ATCC 26904]